MTDSEEDIPLEGRLPRSRTGTSPPPPSEIGSRVFPNSTYGSPRSRREEDYFEDGGGGGNLRGSYTLRTRRGYPEREREVHHYIPKEIKLVVKALPETYAAYPGYRRLLKQKIRPCGMPGSFTTPFLAQLE